MPETPRTEAGRALEQRIAYDKDPARYEPGDYFVEYRPLILAIEAEAAAAERARLRAEVEALPIRTGPGYISRTAVLALLVDPAEPETSDG